ncbi:protein disulfide-isomerase precursor [Ascosphaera pollenicola]|nr:protein disulfide-isomerase precursor [Ascosphaera pollenicola]
MIKQSLPAVTSVNTAEDLEDFKALDKVTVVGYYAADDKASSEVFTKIAEELRDSYPFAATSESSLAEAEGVKLPAIALYKDFDEKKDVYTDKFENKSIKTFIKNAATPLIGYMAPETYNSYMSAGIPLAYIFAETKEERDEFAAMLKPVAKEHKGKINFVTIDAKAFGPHADNLNLASDKFPAFAIQDIEGGKKYPFDQSKKITEKAIAAFVSGVLEGKIEPSIKSQPIPEKQDGPVTILVGKNYDEIVNNDEKDVLVEFYAPWCGHCKALAPKYDDLGKLYQNDDLSSKVTIAKIDATANDVPEDIAGFPTIKLYPAGSKTEPVDFTGKRTVEELANFVRDNGKHQVDAWAVAQAAEEKEDKPSESQSASSTTPSSPSSASGKASDEGAKTATESEAAASSESAKVESETEAGEAHSHEEL